MNHRQLLTGLSCALLVLACAPKVQVSTKEPIVINVNIKHEILIRVENDVDDLINDPELFGDLEKEEHGVVSSEGENG